MKPNRFDYVKYDDMAVLQQGIFKDAYSKIAENIEKLYTGRAASLALTALEESYMWVGKQIRDDQIVRNGFSPLQEERNKS
jgi:hypothetical protein